MDSPLLDGDHLDRSQYNESIAVDLDRSQDQLMTTRLLDGQSAFVRLVCNRIADWRRNLRLDRLVPDG